ncbi:hypothetical protein OR571_12995 [Psychrobacillus sp. NEAU-3TGS]|uniref:hypothetical protein n=1 Tax=Psychrobacillus sp. NEAU-3TGS TaxID=2995412 RepID=UPI0024974CB4|nr:hypothetical protein [Psychrobacillus sp. NEAU-3TGS]MDI2588006.1 hypothetical protein [Psychrobacillus sp. NEAU-3TGS]
MMDEMLQTLMQPVKEVIQTFTYILLFGLVFVCLEWLIPSSKRLLKFLFIMIICFIV